MRSLACPSCAAPTSTNISSTPPRGVGPCARGQQLRLELVVGTAAQEDRRRPVVVVTAVVVTAL